MRRSADGAGQLASGADKIGSGLQSGASQVPNLTTSQRTRAGEVVANPVTASATRENELSGPGQIVSTLILPVGLWIGAAALVLLFGAVSRRLLATGVGTGRLVGGALVRGAVVAVAQAVLVVVVVAATLGVSWGALPPLLLVALVAGIAFLAVHQLLQSVFGSAGTVLSIVLLGVQLVAVGGIYPIQLVSAPFQVISPFLPLTAAVNATTAVLTGSSGGAVATGLLSLALWALLAFVLSVAVVARRRTSTAMFSATPALT
ncbi:YhgE/Pip family protein [Amnibacterium kyonggiense]